MVKPKIIFIDWYKTLSDSLFWKNMTNASNWLFVENKHLINPWMRGKYTSIDISKMIGESTGVNYRVIHHELKKDCREMEYVSAEIPELIKFIRKQGIRVVIATDNMDTFRRFTIQGMNLGETFDDYLISCEIGRLKGDFSQRGELLFFKDFMNKSGLKYEEAVLLDDWLDKTNTVKNAGLNSIQVTNPDILLGALRQYACI